jgi:serine/threonine protein kinase
MPLSPGTLLGPYEIVAPIRSGGMGDVYRARDTRLNRTVAVKVAREKFGERSLREARAAAALNHPNICQLYDVGPDYLVMELVDGTPLRPVENPRKMLDLAVQIADGLAAAHAAGIIHRDLKPDNVLVTREGRVKILDFGLAKQEMSAVDADGVPTMAVTNAGTVAGTPTYMSPEQARGLSLDVRTDQFSFGLILHEMATGARTFERQSAAETMTAIIREEATPLPPTVPAPLRWIIERCLEKDPAERYDSTRDLHRELRRLRDRWSDATMGPATLVTASPSPWRMRTVVFVAAAVLVGFTAAALWPIPPSEPPPIVPFATEFELQAMPRWSPKGDQIAYVAPVDGILQVFVRPLGSSTPEQITRETEPARNPMWSADATRLYYITGTRPDMVLRSIALAGGPSEKVLDRVVRADLSPNGQSLALLVRDAQGAYQLAFSSPPWASPQPDSRVPLYDIAIAELAFDVSGKYLGISNNDRFLRVPLDGGPSEEMQRGTRAPFTWRFTWSADSGTIIGDTGVAARDSHLWFSDLTSGAARNVTAGPTQDAFPALTPDGKTLAFASGEIGFDIINVPLDGSQPREVMTTSRVEVAPAWAPDGIRFAYVTNRSGAQEIRLRNSLDGSEQPIAGEQQFGQVDWFFDCAISPDNTRPRVAYRTMQGDKVAIWISPMSGDSPVQLWDDPSLLPQRGPSWSPDGNWIAYYGSHDEKPAILKARVGGSGPAEFVAYQASSFPPRWSPRGDWIAFRDGDALRIVSPDGRQNRVVSGRIWQTYGWSKDGTGVYGIAYGANRRLILGRVDVATQKETEIADLGPIPPAFDIGDSLNEFPYRGFSLHPDGHSFLTSVLKIKTQIYLMKDFDRTIRLADRWFKR